MNMLVEQMNELHKKENVEDNLFVKNNGDIIIKKKPTKTKTNNPSILANIFKEMIKNDVKKNRV